MIETKIYKTYKLKEFDIGDKGAFKAVFATMNVIDAHDDLTLPGAFREQEIIIGGWNHASWNTGTESLPVGRGRIFEKGNEAIVEGQFFLSTTAGYETYKTIKEIGKLQEWSYSLPEIEYEYKTMDDRIIRILKKIKVNEVAPVLMGAGKETRTIDIKTNTKEKKGLSFLEHTEKVKNECKELTQRIKKIDDLRKTQNRLFSKKSIDYVKTLKKDFEELLDILTQVEKRSADTLIESKVLYNEMLKFQEIQFNNLME